jgi:hypothetical protein
VRGRHRRPVHRLQDVLRQRLIATTAALLLYGSVEVCRAADLSGVLIAYTDSTDKPIPCVVLGDAATTVELRRASAAFGCAPMFAISAVTSDAKFFAALAGYKFTTPSKACFAFVTYGVGGLHSRDGDVATAVALAMALEPYFPDARHAIETSFVMRVAAIQTCRWLR